MSFDIFQINVPIPLDWLRNIKSKIMSDGEFQSQYPLESYGLVFIDFSDANETLRLHRFPKTQNMTGIEKIAAERLEQKIKHRKSVRDDYRLYPDYELASLAEALLSGDSSIVPDCFPAELVNKLWSKSYEDKLVIAGALIAAEIDRLNFEE